MSYSNVWQCQRHIFLVPAPGEGPKGQITFNFNYKVNFKDFKPNSVCLLTNERYIKHQTGFSFHRLGHAPGEGLGSTGGGGQKFHFAKNQPNLVCELLTKA